MALFIAFIVLFASAHSTPVVRRSTVDYESELGDTISTNTTIHLEGVCKFSADSEIQFIDFELLCFILDAPRRNCKEIYDQLDAADRITGLYRVSQTQNQDYVVYCDMKLGGGGWTVIQRRVNDKFDFDETWNSYQSGFGKYSENYWVGLDNIRSMTENGDMELWIGMESYESGVIIPTNRWQHARYGKFIVGDETSDYTLTIAEFDGTDSTAADSFSHSGNHHNGRKFSTKDKDNDEYTSGNCATDYKGGWWFGDCRNTNLNGKYYNSATIPGGSDDGISWQPWYGLDKSLKTIVMAIRPK